MRKSEAAVSGSRVWGAAKIRESIYKMNIFFLLSINEQLLIMT